MKLSRLAYILMGALILCWPKNASASDPYLNVMPATTTAIGGVMCGSGTSCASDGTLSVVTTSGGTVTSLTAGSANIVLSPTTITTTGTIGLSATPSVTTLTAGTVTGAAIVGGTLAITGNSSLSGTTTTTNLTVTGQTTLSALTTGMLATNGTGAVSVVSNIVSGLCGTVFPASGCVSFFGYYDPRWYGGHFDGRTRTDITTTASNAQISSAGYSFTAGDVNATITIDAGNNNTTIGTTTTGSQAMTSVGSLTGVVV
jgi:hypothetical protein